MAVSLEIKLWFFTKKELVNILQVNQELFTVFSYYVGESRIVKSPVKKFGTTALRSLFSKTHLYDFTSIYATLSQLDERRNCQ